MTQHTARHAAPPLVSRRTVALTLAGLLAALAGMLAAVALSLPAHTARASAPPAGIVVTAAQHPSGHAGESLPEWFRAERFIGHPHCLLVGAEFHPHKRAIICDNGTAHIAHKRALAQRGAEVDTRNMPAKFRWWGSERGSAIVAGMGTADTTATLGDDGWTVIS